MSFCSNLVITVTVFSSVNMAGRPRRNKSANMDTNFEYNSSISQNSASKKDSRPETATGSVKTSLDNKDFGADIASMIVMLEDRIRLLENPEKRRESISKSASKASSPAFKQPKNTGSSASGGLFPFDEDAFNIHLAAEEEDHMFLQRDGKNSKSSKSGYDIKVHENIRNKVLWPHGFLSKLQFITNTEPDNLNMDAFIYGYTAILLSLSGKHEELEGRLRHLKQIMWHCINHNWKSAREFHYSVVREIEVGNMIWSDEYKMGMMSLAAVHQKQPYARNASKTFQVYGSQEEDHYPRSMCCKPYNYSAEGCNFEKSGTCKKLHACCLCEKKGFFNKHKATECKK